MTIILGSGLPVGRDLRPALSAAVAVAFSNVASKDVGHLVLSQLV
jgi:hypothetical protein